MIKSLDLFFFTSIFLALFDTALKKKKSKHNFHCDVWKKNSFKKDYFFLNSILKKEKITQFNIHVILDIFLTPPPFLKTEM